MLDLADRYFVPEGVELRAFTHGLMPRTVPAMMHAFTEDWRTRGVDAWNGVPNHWRPDTDEPIGWWSLPTYLGDRFVAPLLGAGAGSCIMQPHVNAVVNALLSADEPFRDGRREVVVSELEFPSVLHTVQQWAGLRGFEPVIVPPDADGCYDHDGVLRAIGPRTAWVFCSHVGFTTSECLPHPFLQDVAERVHRHGGYFGIDGYHAASTMPVRAPETGADVYFGGLLKEASGSAGNAYLWVRPGVELSPRLTGWFGDAEPFAFNRAPAPHPEVRRRFLGGTTNVASLYHAVEGVRILLDVGLEAVRADSLAKTALAIARAEAAGLRLRSPRGEARGAMVILEAPAADRLAHWLKTRGVFTDSRQARYLRFAPWLWNTADDLEHALDALAEGVRTGAYRNAVPPTEAGPVT